MSEVGGRSGGDTLLTTDGELVASAAPELAATLPASSATPELARPRIGRYELVRSLGTGGMGVVWEAIDPELGRGVAIKLLREERRARLAERLRREAKTLAQLHHPNVVAVYDVGVDDGELYIVMQLVDGMTLDRALAARSLGRGERIALLVQAGRGLAAAHTAGIVHRDFKPSNVLVDGDGTVRVSDFGLARASEASTSDVDPGALAQDDASITRGDLVGTPAYMAPEQFLRGPVTPATDQFSFCVTLWEALLGERPFPGRDLEALREAVLAGHHTELPARLPRRIRAVLLRGLAVDPAKRFASMEELLDELEPDRRWLWIAGGVGIAALATSVTLLAGPDRAEAIEPCLGIDDSLLAGKWDAAAKTKIHAAFVRTGNGNAEDTFARVSSVLDGYARGWVEMRKQACEATEVRHEQSAQLLDMRIYCLDGRAAELAAIAHVLGEAVQSRAVDKSLDAALRLTPLDGCADREALMSVVRPPVDPQRRARVTALEAEIAKADAESNAGQVTTALGDTRKLIDEIRNVDYPPLLGRALLLHASLENLGGDPTKVEPLLHEAAEAAARGQDDRLVAKIWLHLVLALRKARKFDAALAVEPYLRTATTRAGNDPLLAADQDWVFAMVLREQGKLDAAEQRFRAALARLPASEHARRADFLQSHAVMLKGLGQNTRAIDALVEVTRIYEQTYGSQSYKLATGLYNLSRQYRAVGRCDEAKQSAERSLAIYVRILGADNPELILDYVSLGDLAAVCLKDVALARKHYEKAIKLAETSPQGTAQLANAVGGYGWGLKELGHMAEAEPLFMRALALSDQKKDPVAMASNLRGAGEVRLSLGRAADAKLLLERAAELYDGMKAEVDLAAVLTGIGSAHLALNHPAQAIAPLERALTLAIKSAPQIARVPQFELARALWDSGRERARARDLAREAEAAYAKLGPPGAAKHAEITAWLRARP